MLTLEWIACPTLVADYLTAVSLSPHAKYAIAVSRQREKGVSEILPLYRSKQYLARVQDIAEEMEGN